MIKINILKWNKQLFFYKIKIVTFDKSFQLAYIYVYMYIYIYIYVYIYAHV